MTELNNMSPEKAPTAEEYLRLDSLTPDNQEYFDGKIATMPKYGRIHSLLVTNTTICVGSRTAGQNCEIYASNMRVRLNSNRYCYPSVVLVNGKPQFLDGNNDTLINPTILFEIFSLENRPNQKIESFLEIESVKECVLVKENEMRVEHYLKQGNRQWLYKIYTGKNDVISLDSVNCKVSVSEIYAHINFGAVANGVHTTAA